jgi:protein-disulfide isomerase
MSLTRRVFSAVALTAALALGACGGGDAPSADTQTAFERGNDRGTGSADATVTVIEYASVACPHCATFHEEVWPTLESEYIASGQVRFVFREMVTGSPQFAMAGFALAHCVADDRYFEMVDLLFQQQRAIFQAARAPGGARGQYLAIARQMGLSEDEFIACLNNEDVNAEILANHEQALEDGVNSTPTFLFNDRLLESKRAPGESEYTYFLGGRQLLIDGESVPAIVDEATFVRILDHLLADDDATDGAATEE